MSYILHAPDKERVPRPRTAAWFNQNFFTKLDLAISISPLTVKMCEQRAHFTRPSVQGGRAGR